MPLRSTESLGYRIRSLDENAGALLEIVEKRAPFGIDERDVFIYEFEIECALAESVDCRISAVCL